MPNERSRSGKTSMRRWLSRKGRDNLSNKVSSHNPSSVTNPLLLLLQSAVQAYGAPTWGVSMLSLTSVDPNVRLSTGAKCKKPLGSLCLDGTSLTVAATEVIIAFGAVVVIMLLAIPCVVLEWRRKSGRVRHLGLSPAR